MWEKIDDYLIEKPQLAIVIVGVAIIVLVFLIVASFNSISKATCLSVDAPRRWSMVMSCQEYVDGEWIKTSELDTNYSYNDDAIREFIK